MGRCPAPGAVKDYLPWRQRLGYDFTWLLTTEEQRVSILQRLLIAMRNGQVDVLAGTDERPAEIAIRASAVPGSSAARLELPAAPVERHLTMGRLAARL